jgi:hypothetical protein
VCQRGRMSGQRPDNGFELNAHTYAQAPTPVNTLLTEERVTICMHGHHVCMGTFDTPPPTLPHQHTHTRVLGAGPRGKSKGIAKAKKNAGGKGYRQHRQPAAGTGKGSKSKKKVARDEGTEPQDGAAESTPEPVLIYECMHDCICTKK